ncbi:hypothetical protein AB0G42_10190 [Streptomyces yangpuensis]|uniref:hypothetical protein n=1 Tax=Streptomyces yangpuensis TaxID=1648182 RepID=UPI0034281438
MAATLDEQSVKRLAYIRMLYEQGVAQAKQPMPMGASSLLSLHDSVEMFLVLSSDVLNEQVDKNTTFMDYWKKIKSVQLSGAHGMRRLNDARNGLKHAGVMPSPEVVQQALSDAFAFFDDNVSRVFSVPPWSVDTSYVIPQRKAREFVRLAAARFEAGEGGAALALLQMSLVEVLGNQQWWPYGTLMAKIAKPRSGLAGLSLRTAFGRSHSNDIIAAGRALEHLEEAVTALQDGLQWMALGGNLHHYARFQSLTPRSIYWMAGDDEASVQQALDSPDVTSRTPTREEFEFCRQFVVTTALRRADLDAHILTPSWQREAASGGES